MKYYHGTSYDNLNSILEEGLIPSDCKQLDYVFNGIIPAETLQGRDLTGVFVFTDPRDAQDFANDNWAMNWVVFELDVDLPRIPDPEYKDVNWLHGEAYLLLTDQPIPVSKYTVPEWLED